MDSDPVLHIGDVPVWPSEHPTPSEACPFPRLENAGWPSDMFPLGPPRRTSLTPACPILANFRPCQGLGTGVRAPTRDARSRWASVRIATEHDTGRFVQIGALSKSRRAAGVGGLHGGLWPCRLFRLGATGGGHGHHRRAPVLLSERLPDGPSLPAGCLVGPPWQDSPQLLGRVPVPPVHAGLSAL